MTCVGIGTSAVQQKPFFEIVRDGVNSMKITVTGNTMESEAPTDEVIYDETERVYYESWDEVKEENPDIMTPGYIPEGLELEELYGEDYEVPMVYNGFYKDEKSNSMYIRIRVFKDEFAQIGLKSKEDWTLLCEDDSGINYYSSNSEYKAEWKKENCLYVVIYNDIDELKNIVAHFC